LFPGLVIIPGSFIGTGNNILPVLPSTYYWHGPRKLGIKKGPKPL